MIIGIAKYLYAEGKTCTFDELAQKINSSSGNNYYHGGRGVAKVVSEAFQYAADKYGPIVADMIAKVFRDKNGNKAY